MERETQHSMEGNLATARVATTLADRNAAFSGVVATLAVAQANHLAQKSHALPHIKAAISSCKAIRRMI